MQEVFTFLADNLDLVMSIVVGFLCFLVTFVRTGSIKKAIKHLQEVDIVKHPARKGQEFSETVTDYILDPVSNELAESPIPKNIQAEIDSYIDVALDRALEKFMPKVIEDNDTVGEYTQTSQDLATMGEAFEVAEEYRDRYNLDPKMSVADIYKYVGEQADKMKADLLKYNQPQEVKPNVESKAQEAK